MKNRLLNLGMAALLGCGLAGCGEQPAVPESVSVATPTPEWTEETDVSTEPVITCQRNGVAYAYNGIGWGEYGVITDVKKTENGYEISAEIWNDIAGSKEVSYTFLLTASDNMYGYTLDWDSVNTDF